jgi:hypothetical protein
LRLSRLDGRDALYSKRLVIISSSKGLLPLAVNISGQFLKKVQTPNLGEHDSNEAEADELQI